jgi:hypothetical protein
VVITGGDFFLLFRDSFLLFLIINRFFFKTEGKCNQSLTPISGYFWKKAPTINELRRIFPRKRKSFYKEYYKQINRFLTFLL